MSTTLSERLTERFYDWEVRGRGWYVYDAPVTPEPPFKPFIGHYVDLVAPSAVDDGREHTRISALVETVSSWFKAKPPKPEPSPEVEETIRVDESAERERFSIVLPAGVTYPKNLAEQFLLNLSQCRHPVCLEFVGTGGAPEDGHPGLPGVVMVFLDVEADDAAVVRSQLQSHYPDAIVTPGRDVVRETWDTESTTLIAELGLANEFMLPLRGYSSYAPDPLIGVIGALGSLQNSELGCVQVIFEPVRHAWAQSIVRAVTTPDGKAFFGNDSGFVKQATDKISTPLYGVVIRTLGQSPIPGREREIVRNLAGAFTVLEQPHGNSLIPLENNAYADYIDHATDTLERRSRRSGMILSADELLTLVHLPGASVATPALVRSIEKTKAAPSIAQGRDVIFGDNVHAGENVVVGQSVEQRVRHTHVIGASGSGKSTLLSSMIWQDIHSGSGCAVLDPHGDLIDQVLACIPPERYDDVVLLDLSDDEYPVPFNILSAHSELEKTLLASDLAAVFRRLATSWGDQMTAVLANGILAFLESDRGGTLADLRRFLVEKRFRDDYLSSVQDPEVAYYWRKEFALLTGKPQGSVVTRLNTFLRPKPIRYMVAHGDNRLDMGSIMDEGKIFLARIPQGAIGEENTYLLGTLLVSAFHRSVLCRQEKERSARRPFYLYIDEFHHFITPSMAPILSGARKYGLGLILAHQELKQLESRDSDVASAVLSNPDTRICFRLGDRDAKQLESGFASFNASDLQNLSVGEAICRMERSEYDFNLSVPLPPEVEESVANERVLAIQERSRARYAVPVQESIDRLAAAHELYDAPEREHKPSPKRGPKPTPKPTPAPTEPAVESLPITSPLPMMPQGTPPVSAAEAIVPPTESAKPQSTPGRGGPRHKSIQSKIKQFAEGMGWGAQIEKPILNGRGAVDVALAKGEVSIACEISITTPTEHECGNISKCTDAGFTHVAMIADDADHLQRIKARAVEVLSGKTVGGIHFMSLQELFVFIREHEETASMSETHTRGRKVTIKRSAPGSSSDSTGQAKSIGRTIAKALQRKQSKGKGEK